MGFQIPGPTKGKVQYLVDKYQAVVLDRPPNSFDKIPDHQAIICVIDTLQYEVASYAYSLQEFSLLDEHSDFRSSGMASPGGSGSTSMSMAQGPMT
jgi:hypothetical protein